MHDQNIHIMREMSSSLYQDTMLPKRIPRNPSQQLRYVHDIFYFPST